MLFNSFDYILFFVPIVLFLYFLFNKFHLIVIGKSWLILASLFFYGYITPKYIPLLLFSIFFNFAVSSALNSKNKANKKVLLIFGILINILLISYFKYMDFFIANINAVFNSHIQLLHIVLPLGISFFTFQQIAYLCDSYEGKTKEYDFLSYSLFVLFFPQLVAGPIVHHEEMVPQFEKLKNKFLNWKNLSEGLLVFTVGLFKKVIIADTLAKWAALGFDGGANLSFLEAWITIFSYTFQIYYDFSGYTDMALGVAQMFNIKLPQNFNNPYRSIDIQDFWRRWHMTLSRFLKDYVYIPLGGNRKGTLRTYLNLFVVFLICGIWHGASWLFVLWGIVHGIAIVINRLWKKLNVNLPYWFAWSLNFLFVSLAWVLFRSDSLTTASGIYKSAIGLCGFAIPKISHFKITFKPLISNIDGWETISLVVLPLLVAVVFFTKFHENIKSLQPNKIYMFAIIFMAIFSFAVIFSPKYISPFIYFNF